MKCTESCCDFNCQGHCQRVGAILDDLEIGIPEPDGCYEMIEKTAYTTSEE